jgi:hypothetical protein
MKAAIRTLSYLFTAFGIRVPLFAIAFVGLALIGF